MRALVFCLFALSCSGSDPFGVQEPLQRGKDNPVEKRGAHDYAQRQRDCWDMPNAQACYEVGLNYELGLSATANRQKAGDYYKKACDLDHQAEHCAAAHRMGR